MTKQNLENAIEQAWIDYNNIFAHEIESGYDDAMDMAERREAEGYATGLGVAYFMTYNNYYEVKTEICDEDNYKNWL